MKAQAIQEKSDEFNSMKNTMFIQPKSQTAKTFTMHLAEEKKKLNIQNTSGVSCGNQYEEDEQSHTKTGRAPDRKFAKDV